MYAHYAGGAGPDGGLTINALTGGRGRTGNSGSVTLERRRIQSMIGRPNKEQMPHDFLGAEDEEIAMRAK